MNAKLIPAVDCRDLQKHFGENGTRIQVLHGVDPDPAAVETLRFIEQNRDRQQLGEQLGQGRLLELDGDVQLRRLAGADRLLESGLVFVRERAPEDRATRSLHFLQHPIG